MAFKIFGFGGPGVPVVNVQEAHDLHTKRAAYIVDVREPFEWDEAHVAGARHIPLGEIEARLADIPQDKPVLVFCRSGNRSGKATEKLLAAGLKDVRNIEGGILAWNRAGLPLKVG